MCVSVSLCTTVVAYTTQHTTVLIIFLLNLQTIAIAQMLEGRGAWFTGSGRPMGRVGPTLCQKLTEEASRGSANAAIHLVELSLVVW